MTLLSFLPSPTSAKSSWVPVTWTNAEGFQMEGLYHPPAQSHRLTWIFLHGLGSVKEEWMPFAQRMVQQGYGILLYDARGHGKSVHLSQGGIVDYRRFDTIGPGSPWDHMVDDLGEAVDLLKNKYNTPAQRVAVGGASLGANVALLYASRNPKIPALILLSPGLEYAGLTTEEAFQRYGKRLLFIAASPGDAYSYSSVSQFAAQRHDPFCTVANGEGASHGVNMLKEPFVKKLLAWMKE